MARAMKDSGIEWIGVIPETWRVVRGKTVFRQRNEKGNDVCLQLLSPTQKYGVIPQAEYEQLSGMKAVKLDIAADYSQLKTIHEGDFCISLRSFQGGFEYSQHEGVVSPAYQVFYPHIDCNDGYFKYLFKDRTFIDKMNSYTLSLRDGKNIAFSDFANTYIPFPPIDEQTRIAAFLDTECARIDAVIEQTRASIEEYKKLKQSVITQAVTKGIRPSGKMKDSGVEWIGEIPEEWTVRPLKSYIDILPGYAFSSDDFNVDQGIRLLRGINVAPGSIRWDDVVYWNKEITDQIKQFELKEGDLVVGLDRPWISDGTRAAFLHEGDMPCLLLQRVCRIRPNKDTDIRFVYHTIVGKSFEDALGTDTTGVSVPHISTKQIQQYLVAFPCKEEQMEISDYIDEKSANIDALIQKKQQLLDELESYKKSLIFEYVTGKKVI